MNSTEPREQRLGERSGRPNGFGQRVLVATAIVLGVVLLLVTLWFARNALLVAFAGVLLAITLRIPADWLAEHTRLSERWALAVTLLVLLIIFVSLGFWTAPRISDQTQQLTQQLPESIKWLRNSFEQFALGRWVLELIPQPEDVNRQQVGQVVRRATGMAYTAGHVLSGLVILVFVSIYLAIHPRLYTSGLLRLVPQHRRPRAAEIFGATGYTLRWWLIGTLARMVAVGLMTFVGLWLLGVPLAFLLALCAFLLDFVPYFGPIVAAIPAILLTLVDSPQQALYVTLLYVAVQQIESLLISPIIYERTVYLPPVLTILVQIVMFAMFGALGILLATPLAAVALLWVKMLYVEGILGDTMNTADKEIGPAEVPPVPKEWAGD